MVGGKRLNEAGKPRKPVAPALDPTVSEPAPVPEPVIPPKKRKGAGKVPVLKQEPQPAPVKSRSRQPAVAPVDGGGGGGAGGDGSGGGAGGGKLSFSLKNMPLRYNEVVGIANNMLNAYQTDVKAIKENLKPLIDDMIAHGTSAATHMAGLQHLNSEQKEHITQLEKEARSRIKDLKKTLAPLKKQLAGLTTSDSAKDAEIQRLGGVVADKDLEIGRKDAEIGRKNADIAARDKTIGAKDTELAGKDLKIAELTQKGKELTARVKKLSDDLDDKQDELEYTKATYEDIVSWYSSKLKESDKVRRTVEREAARLRAELEQELDVAWVNPMKDFDRDHVRNYGRFDLKEHLEYAHKCEKGRTDFNW